VVTSSEITGAARRVEDSGSPDVSGASSLGIFEASARSIARQVSTVTSGVLLDSRAEEETDDPFVMPSPILTRVAAGSIEEIAELETTREIATNGSAMGAAKMN